MCQPVLSTGLAEIRERVRAARCLSLFLDFDGTLAPIVLHPDEAQLDESTRQALALLSSQDDILTAIVSGRSVDDVRARIGLPNLVYAGNHGLEIIGPQLHFVQPFALANRPRLRQLSEELADSLAGIGGTWVEWKGLTATVHFRQAAEENVPEVRQIVRTTLVPFASVFRPADGNMVIEIVPRTGWDKGAAVLWINHHLGNTASLPIYIGDDRTDEDAFRVLPGGITVRVGRCDETCARYCLADPVEVHKFLVWLTVEGAGRETSP